MKALGFVIAAFATLIGDRVLAAAPPMSNPAAPMLSASFSAQPDSFNGACPVSIKFTGTIAGAAGQPVSYYFTRTIKGGVSSTKPTSASLDHAGKLSVADTVSIGASQAGPGSDELDLVSSTVKATASFAVTCVAANGPLPALHIFKPHVFVPEGSVPYFYPHTPDISRCGGFPPNSLWQIEMKSNLRAGFAAEKAYFQEKDAFSYPSQIGFSPEAPQAFCVKWIVTVGHYADQPKTASTFFMTGRHINGGAMLCVTDQSGTGHAAGAVGISNAGGPILTPEACGSLPPAPTINPYPYQLAPPR